MMAVIWIGSWLAQSLTGVTDYNAERLDHHQDAVSWGEYLTRPDFWEKTLQNWQSEFLAGLRTRPPAWRVEPTTQPTCGPDSRDRREAISVTAAPT